VSSDKPPTITSFSCFYNNPATLVSFITGGVLWCKIIQMLYIEEIKKPKNNPLMTVV